MAAEAIHCELRRPLGIERRRGHTLCLLQRRTKGDQDGPDIHLLIAATVTDGLGRPVARSSSSGP